MYFICMSVLPACMFVHHMCVWCQQWLGEGVRPPEPGIIMIVI